MFHFDYLSCFLTVLATILLARKSWIGLLIAIVNSLIVCAIALRTSQLGFIPANLFCICIYAFNIRSWLKEQTQTHPAQVQPQESGSVADGPRMSPVMHRRTAAGMATEGARISNCDAGGPLSDKSRAYKRLFIVTKTPFAGRLHDRSLASRQLAAATRTGITRGNSENAP
jgi:hypothetical protein